jgi:hypothetical protein
VSSSERTKGFEPGFGKPISLSSGSFACASRAGLNDRGGSGTIFGDTTGFVLAVCGISMIPIARPKPATTAATANKRRRPQASGITNASSPATAAVAAPRDPEATIDPASTSPEAAAAAFPARDLASSTTSSAIGSVSANTSAIVFGLPPSPA